MNDYLRGYFAGYMTKLSAADNKKDQRDKKAGSTVYDQSKLMPEDKIVLTRKELEALKNMDPHAVTEAVINESLPYLLAAGSGALGGAGIGAAIAPEGRRGEWGLYGAGIGTALAPITYYLATKIANKRAILREPEVNV